jgi:hypothetical protein
VLKWLEAEKQYIRSRGIPENGIARLKTARKIDAFDCVLIDGSEFTGGKELDLVYGSRYIMLDDINSLKNLENHRRLSRDRGYQLLAADFKCRNGFSIFYRGRKAA